MTEKKNKFEFTSPEQKTQYINDVISFFKDERDEEVGYIAAEQVLDFLLQTIGEDIYRKAITDCKKLLKEKFDDVEVELDILTPAK